MSRPLVLLHGFTGSPESWATVRELLADAPPPTTGPEGTGPARSIHAPAIHAPSILAPAILGHDGTLGPDGIESFEAEVDRLADEVRTRGLAGAHLAGYSMGGRLALGLLVRHPDLFASATLIGASPGLAEAAEREGRADQDAEWARLLDEEGLDRFVAAWEALPLFATQARLPDRVVEAQRRIRRSHDPRGLARSLHVVGLGQMPDYGPRLGALELPIRLVVGARDAKFRRLAAEMDARLPRSRITVVPDAGHNVVLESPAEIARLLREDTNP